MENRIKKIRKARGLTMQELADLVYPPTVSPQIMKLERGERGLDLGWMARLSKALNCEPYELLPEEWQPKTSPSFQVINTSFDSQDEDNARLMLDIVDTLNYFLKEENATMDEEDRFKLINFLYKSKAKKEQLPLAINAWYVANPSTFKKISGG